MAIARSISPLATLNRASPSADSRRSCAERSKGTLALTKCSRRLLSQRRSLAQGFSFIALQSKVRPVVITNHIVDERLSIALAIRLLELALAVATSLNQAFVKVIESGANPPVTKAMSHHLWPFATGRDRLYLRSGLLRMSRPKLSEIDIL